MNLLNITTLVLLLTVAIVINAEADYKRAKAYRYYDNEEALDESSKEIKLIDSRKPSGASSGRLFMKKFFFNKLFGQKQKPVIIPIIITGGNTDNGTDIVTPTDTPIDTPTNTDITTNTDTAPITDTETPETAEAPTGANPDDQADAENPDNRILLYGLGSNGENNQQSDEETAIADNQTFDAAPEFVLTDQDIKRISSAKANRVITRINLRLRGSKRDQVISIRIPDKYRSYFQNAQRGALNRNKKESRPVKRRVIRKRRNRRRPNKNKNKRRRVFVTA